MAVVVQRMVEADVAGVLFTIDPARGRRDRMVVEAVFGLGEAVVSGEVTPDQYVLARDGRVKREPHHAAARRRPRRRRRHATGAAGPERGAARTLDDEQLAELAAVGRDLEDRLGMPQDIEWAIEDGELFVLQARPVTA